MALRRNILVFHQGALGDFIITWPLTLGLARVFAQSRTFYVTAGQKGALAEKLLRVDGTDAEAGWHQLFAADPQLPPAAVRLMEGAHCVISFVSGPEDRWASNVRKFAPEATLVTLSTLAPPEVAGHITQHILAQLRPWPVIHAAAEQMLQSVSARGIGGWRGPGGPVVLHPGAGSTAKCWPAASYLQLARQLAASGRAVQVLLGEVERERWPARQIEQFAAVAPVHFPSTLIELQERISGASLFIGNDSGPSHLAGIIGVPTVVLFGPAHAGRWKPLGPRVNVLGGAWDAITVRDVLRASASP